MFGLHVDIIKQLDKIKFIKLSNRDEFGDKIKHEISFDSRESAITLIDLIQALRDLKLYEDRIDSNIAQEIGQMQKEGKLLIRTPGAIRREDLPEKIISDTLKVRRSRYDLQDIFFIIKGIEKEDTATIPPFKIEVEGDFVSVSRENILPLVEELMVISRVAFSQLKDEGQG